MEIQDRTDLCFPHLLNSSCRKPTLHWSEAVLLNSVLLFISLITVVLNLLIIISVSHFRQLHTPTNILLVSLGVSDFFVGLLLMPFEIYKFTFCWILGDAMCVFLFLLIGTIICASIWNIVLISVDRYVAICYPLHYPTRISLTRVKYCVCLCWFCASSCSFFYAKDELIQPGRSKSCIGECIHYISYAAGINDLTFNFIFPVTTIIVLYLRVFVVAVSQARAMRSHITVASFHSATSGTKRSELKAARTLGVLVVVYLMCYCPYYCYSIVDVNLTSTSYVSILCFVFYSNSCLNPVIYALFYPWFRKAVKIIVTLQILQPGSHEAKLL
ncbi:trace amine-associated receptor 13c-like [Xiphophorus couchianus]|uniref:trace amine-associated receptor 13c-like n=1 Tax=Xiphophorus couchianus TaxID=32473 RepID=UPI001015E312|nr:trace amine-associated receptor 13c-like [Xiphophorus couchianus]